MIRRACSGVRHRTAAFLFRLLLRAAIIMIKCLFSSRNTRQLNVACQNQGAAVELDVNVVLLGSSPNNQATQRDLRQGKKRPTTRPPPVAIYKYIDSAQKIHCSVSVSLLRSGTFCNVEHAFALGPSLRSESIASLTRCARDAKRPRYYLRHS